MSVYDYYALKGLGLTDVRISQLLPHISVNVFEPDDVIWSGVPAEHPFCHVLAGLVSASVRQSGATSCPLDIHTAGAWFGEAAIFDQQPFEYLSLTETRLLMVPQKDALSIFNSDANFSRYIARMSSWRAQRNAEMLSLGRLGNPSLCVVFGLALLAESMTNGSSHLPNTLTKFELKVSVKQSIVAAICGVSRGVFSEQIQHLVASGWLKVNYSNITMLRVNGWISFAQGLRKQPLNDSKPAINELIELLEVAVQA